MNKIIRNFVSGKMIMIPDIHIEDYAYPLPDERIAKYPLPRRDASKLLHYRAGEVSETRFSQLPDLLPEAALLVYNDTRVVPARLHFQRPTGGHVEIFCLEPIDPAEYNLSFASTQTCTWKCVLGNAKRWKAGPIRLYNPAQDAAVERMDLSAELLEREGQTGIVKFCWKDASAFSSVLELCGSIPIPPYLNRSSEPLDAERYQTTYARVRGSVAAPTAGLHFTPELLQRILQRGMAVESVCLHVGAGTFLPVKTSAVADHPMHREPFSVPLSLLKTLCREERPVVAVGTTSVRTLESLYYAGVQCIETGRPGDVGQWEPYLREYPWSTREALEALVGYLEAQGLPELRIGTRIIIVPGFRFRIVSRLVTNFHQSESTLILLVSAFVGGDWRTIYDYALAHDFRFLSYGDSSLLERV